MPPKPKAARRAVPVKRPIHKVVQRLLDVGRPSIRVDPGDVGELGVAGAHVSPVGVGVLYACAFPCVCVRLVFGSGLGVRFFCLLLLRLLLGCSLGGLAVPHARFVARALVVGRELPLRRWGGRAGLRVTGSGRCRSRAVYCVACRVSSGIAMHASLGEAGQEPTCSDRPF